MDELLWGRELFTHVTSRWALREHRAVLEPPSFQKVSAGGGGGGETVTGRAGGSRASARSCAKRAR